MPHQLANHVGQKIGELTLMYVDGKQSNGAVVWKCQCSCGKTTMVSSSSLNSGHKKSCGHLLIDSTRKRATTHGMRNTRLYTIFDNMNRRCKSMKVHNAHRYSLRGITVCKEWKTFEAFRDWALDNGYADDLEIDRINNDKGYSPDNCRWVTRRENANNRHVTRFITYDHETMPFTCFAEKYASHIHVATLYNRIFRMNWSIEDAITRPIQKHKRK